VSTIPDMVGYAEIFALDTTAAWAASRRYRYHDVVFVLPAWPEISVTDSERRRNGRATSGEALNLSWYRKRP
jgi:predicted ATPase